MLVYFISLYLLSEFTKLFCISSMCGTGSFSTKWLYCKVSGRSVSSQVETVVTCVFLFSRHKANFLTRPCDCLFYIVFYQWNHSSLLFWKAWVRLLSHAGKGKKKVLFCLFKKTKQCTLLFQSPLVSVNCRGMISCHTGFILYTDFYSILIHRSIHLLSVRAPCSFLIFIISLLLLSRYHLLALLGEWNQDVQVPLFNYLERNNTCV